MASKWKKVKLAIGSNMCLHVPKTTDDSSSSAVNDVTGRFSDAVSLSDNAAAEPTPPTTPTFSSSSSRLSKSSFRSSSKKTCAICLGALKSGQGHAIFTAECSHSFHFHCITSNVKHGNRICPICRAKWNEVPFQSHASSNLTNGRSRINPIGLARDDAWMTVVRRIPHTPPDITMQAFLANVHEPAVFDDDEVQENQHAVGVGDILNTDLGAHNLTGTIEFKMFPEVAIVSSTVAQNDFAILIHLKAPSARERHNSDGNSSSRAPVDLVTVLDVSGSMSGTKIAMLKRAMGFVIQNLGPSDRLSVVAFSSTARRLFPLRWMTETGRQEALQAVNSLSSNGGTNIAEALRKGAKVIVERKWKNPVSSIILLSDGQDTYTVSGPGGAHSRTDYKLLVPGSLHHNSGTGSSVPVHSFGFGADHDAAAMHAISELSGGTFSFIEAENVIQDAFAQCIGGLLSVVVQELRVSIKCVHDTLQAVSIKAGSYRTTISEDLRSGHIDVGDLYAEEERDFLVTINIPADKSINQMSLLKVSCDYKDPVSKETIPEKYIGEVTIERPVSPGDVTVSLEVDRQRNRLRAAEAMSEARVLAEHGNLTEAVSVLETCCRALGETVSSGSGDQLCVALCVELREMMERMATRRLYESSGRAYVLSGLSSHSWQRATARGDSTDSSSLLQAYQTPSMVDMVSRSQTLVFGSPSSERKLRQTYSFPARPPQPR